MIQELVQQLVQKAGISQEQAAKAATVAHDFIKSKLPPQMASTVDSFFSGAATSAGNAATAAEAKAEDWKDKAKGMAGEAGDKITDFAGKAKDKAEDLADDAGKKIGEWADKAEDFAGDAIDKIKGMFGGKKNDNA
jgi:ElaB/YqjD/DUF883 family membrane-anchored ribosome-binding protein